MSGRTLYIEEHEDDSTPVTGCGCDGPRRTFGECEPVTDGALTPGDHAPCGRCPDCDGFVYLDRPRDRAEDAVRHVIWAVGQGYPLGDSNLEAAIAALRQRLDEACPGLTFTITAAA